MAGENDSTAPTGANGARRTRKPAKRRRAALTAPQRVRLAMAKGTGMALSPDEVSDLYWRGGLARLALDDDRALQPQADMMEEVADAPQT